MTTPANIPALLLSQGIEINLTVAADTDDYDLYAEALAAGWDGSSALALTCTVGVGIYIGSTSTASPGFQIGGVFPSGSQLHLINNGFILGKGGDGGKGTF